MNNSIDLPVKSSPERLSLSGSYETIYEDGKKKNYFCRFPDCGKLFRYKSEIARHYSTHLSQRPFICPYETCQKGFKRADALENHVRTHTKETPFLCKDCEMKFTTKASLRYHVLKHMNQKAFKCSFPGCNKGFITVFQLKQHEKSICVHKKIQHDNDPNIHMQIMTPSDSSRQNKIGKICISPFLCWNNIPDPEWNKKLNSNFSQSPNENQQVFGDKILDIINENQILKRHLEVSQKVINYLHQKLQYDSLIHHQNY